MAVGQGFFYVFNDKVLWTFLLHLQLCFLKIHLINGLLLWKQFSKKLVLYPIIVFYYYFLANDRNLYPVTHYFLVLCSVEYRRITKLKEHVISHY